MPYIFGPYITKTVTIPEHTAEMLDEDAYWRLTWQGKPDDEGTFFYAKVAFPTLHSAQRQHELEATAQKRKGTPKQVQPRRKPKEKS